MSTPLPHAISSGGRFELRAGAREHARSPTAAAALAVRHHSASSSRSAGGSGSARTAAAAASSLARARAARAAAPTARTARSRHRPHLARRAERARPGSARQEPRRAFAAGHAATPAQAARRRGVGTRPRAGDAHRAVQGREHGHQRAFVARVQAVGGRGVLVRRGEVAERAAGLHPDQVAEHLDRRQAVAGGEREQLLADGVAARGETTALERLHPRAVEREREQRGVVEVAGEAFGLARLGRGARVPARLERDRGQQRRPRGVGQLGGERAARGGHDRRRLLGVVGARPDRGDVVGADHPRGEQRVAELLRGGDRREPVRARLGQPTAAGHGQAAQEAHGRFQPRLRAGPDLAVVRRRRLGPDRVHARGARLGTVQKVLLEAAQRLARLDAELLGELPVRAAQDVQRVAAAPAPGQREREQAPALLTPRMRGDVRVEVGHGLAGTADPQPRVRHGLHREQAQLRQPAPLEQRPVLVVELRERRPAPPRQRLEQPLQPPLGGQVARRPPPRSATHRPSGGCAARSPAPSVTSSPRAGPSARRRSLTNVRTAPTARGGGSGHRSSTRRATGHHLAAGDDQPREHGAVPRTLERDAARPRPTPPPVPALRTPRRDQCR